MPSEISDLTDVDMTSTAVMRQDPNLSEGIILMMGENPIYIISCSGPEGEEVWVEDAENTSCGRKTPAEAEEP